MGIYLFKDFGILHINTSHYIDNTKQFILSYYVVWH